MTFWDEIGNLFGKSIKSAAHEFERTARRNVEDKMHKIRLFVFKQAFMLMFFALALLCLFMALVFFGIEYLEITTTLSFLIVGVIALFLGILLKALN